MCYYIGLDCDNHTKSEINMCPYLIQNWWEDYFYCPRRKFQNQKINDDFKELIDC